MISITAPAYNEAENLEELCRRITNVLKDTEYDYEILIVDNGSSDKTLDILTELNKQDARIKYISLSRNFGHQGALLAGLNHSKGDAVISMDGDLQHPPEKIPEMLTLWKQGYEIVFTNKRENNNISYLRRIFTYLFYFIMSKISGLHLSYGQSDFRLLDRKVVDIICNMSERDKFLRGIVEWVGYKKIGIDYDVSPRFRGISKFSYLHLFSFAFTGILSFSKIPLRLFLISGMFISLTSIIEALYIVIRFSFFAMDTTIPHGWLTITTSIYFLSGVILMAIGVLGEYIGFIFEQTKNRPEFIISHKSDRS
ncbi:MAG: glycosyltransferase family 2 protein [Nitrospirae bacterium]|nr:glycosyltransferase family 2 protein [Nitrospirota bacterium]MBF0540562.1 glycosyltransferase family 2 protein [Nitrospirota bacterium]